MVKVIELSGTAVGGTATITGTEQATGFIEKVDYDWGSGAVSADLVLTAEGVISEAVLTKADLGIADTTFYPRTPANKVADGTAFTNVAEKIFIHQSSFNAVVSEAGTAVYRFLIYVSDE